MKYCTTKRATLTRSILLVTSLAYIGDAIASPPTDCVGTTGTQYSTTVPATTTTIVDGSCVYLPTTSMLTGIGTSTQENIGLISPTNVTVITNAAGTSNSSWANTAGVYEENGSNFIFDNLNIYTNGAYSPGIFTQNVTAGTLSNLDVNNTLNIITSGIGSPGVNISGGSQAVIQNIINIRTSGDNSPGISVTDLDPTSLLTSNLQMALQPGGSIITTGANSSAIEALRGADLYLDGAFLNNISVSGPGSAVFRVSDVNNASGVNPATLGGGDFNLNMSMTAGPNTWGVIAEHSGHFTFGIGSDSGGTAFLITSGTAANPSTITVVSSAVTAGSNIVMGDNSFLDLSPVNSTSMIGSLESTYSTSLISLRFVKLIIGVNNATNNGSMLADSNFAGVITGLVGSEVVKAGTGTLTLSGANTYAGNTTVLSGTLALNAVGAYSGVTTVNSGAILKTDLAANILAGSSGVNINGTWNILNGFSQTANEIVNSGNINFVDVGMPGTTLTDNTNYTGTNGKISINTVLGNDASATDKIIINGNTSGTTTLAINNVGGTGALTGTGILVATVNGASSPTAFRANPVIVNGFMYTLKQGGNGGVANNWYLVSGPAPVAPAPIPSGGPLSLLTLIGLLATGTIYRFKRK